MKKYSIFLLLALIALSTSLTNAQDQAEKDKELLIKAASFLETSPLDSKAKDVRAWGVTYLIQTDKVSVVVCGGDLMKPLLDKKNKNGPEMIGQYMIAMGAFKLQNPDKKDDENAAQLAGLESAVKTYRSIIKDKPKTAYPGMDDLAAKRIRNSKGSRICCRLCQKEIAIENI